MENFSQEKKSSFDRIIGRISEEEAAATWKEAEETFNQQDFEALIAFEKEKTEKELLILSEINEASNAWRRKYGLEDFDIPPQNTHIVKKEVWPYKKSGGYFKPGQQASLIKETSVPLVFAARAFHEMIHFKSYGAIQKTFDENSEREYRTGLSLSPRTKAKQVALKEEIGVPVYFQSLNEALTEECTRQYVQSQAKNLLYSSETEETTKTKEWAKRNNKEALLDENIYYAKKIPETEEIEAEAFAYPNERYTLALLIDDVLEKNPEKFKTRDEVFDVFARAMFTGNMFELAHVMDKTFGKGTLRKIAKYMPKEK